MTTFSFWSQNSKERTNSKLPLVIASHSNFVCGTGYTEQHAVCPLPALRWESDLLQQIRFLCGMPREKQCRKQTACVFFPFYPEPHKNVDIIKNLTWCLKKVLEKLLFNLKKIIPLKYSVFFFYSQAFLVLMLQKGALAWGGAGGGAQHP